MKTMKLNNQLNHKIAQYRQQLAKNPPIFDKSTGYEMKECQGCYCQLLADSSKDFCAGCLGCKYQGCQFGCCDCYSDGSVGWRNSEGKISQGSHFGKPKKLTSYQEQRFELETVLWKIEELIEEVKDKEDTTNTRTAQDIVNLERWHEQSQKRNLKSFSSQELEQELERRHDNETQKTNQ